MGPRALLVAIALLLAAPAAARAKLVAFKSPTGNIRCEISNRSGSFAQCGVRSAHRGSEVGPRGKARGYDLEPFDDLAGRRAVLHYGRSKTFGRYTCTSHKTHMTCRNRRTHHGFSVSRRYQHRF